MYLSSTVALSFFYYIIRFVGVSAVTLLVCLINVPDLHVVSIAKRYVCNKDHNLRFLDQYKNLLGQPFYLELCNSVNRTVDVSKQM